MKDILSKVLATWAGRAALALLLFGLPGIFTYVVPCKPCYDATITVGKLMEDGMDKAAKAVEGVTGVNMPAPVSDTSPVAAQ